MTGRRRVPCTRKRLESRARTAQNAHGQSHGRGCRIRDSGGTPARRGRVPGHLFILVTHLLATVARLMRPGGVRAVAAESMLLKHQLLILNRPRKRSPHLATWDRLLLSFGSPFVHPKRVQKLAVALKPSTFLRFHQALTKLKYHLLYASGCRRWPGPKGPSPELIAANPSS